MARRIRYVYHLYIECITFFLLYKIKKKLNHYYYYYYCYVIELKQFGFINKETKKAYLRNRKQELINKWGIPAEDYDLAIQEIMEEFEEYHGFSRYACWIAKKPL